MIFVDLLPLIRSPVSLGLQVEQIPDGNHVFTGQFRCLRVFNTKVPHPVDLQALVYSYFSGNQTLIYGKIPLMWGIFHPY